MSAPVEEKSVRVNCLTRTFPVITNAILTPVEIHNPYSKAKVDGIGLWDTGATHSCLVRRVAEKLGLVPTGMTQVTGVHGCKTVNTYHIILTLNNKEISLPIQVSETESLGPDGSISMLIGMDVINLGDFVITNFNGSTCMTFRVPSIYRIDFVDDIRKLKTPVSAEEKQHPNDKCNCGSGKKYKYCCGMGRR